MPVSHTPGKNNNVFITIQKGKLWKQQHMAASHVLAGRLSSSVLRGILHFSRPISSHWNNRNHSDLPLVTKTLNYLRNAEKYAATTSRSPAAVTLEDLATETSLVKKLGGLPACINQQSIRSLNKAEMLLLLRRLSTGLFAGTWSTAHTQQLDSECARRVALWEAGTCLLVLDLWLMWLGQNAALKLTYYKVLMREWHLVPGGSEPAHVTQLLFYLGLAKQAPEVLMRSAEKWLEGSLASLSQDDLAIVCQGFFKTSTKMYSGWLLTAVSNRVKEMVDAESPEDDTIICFLKVLRHARYQDPELCAGLSNFLKSRLSPRDTALVVCAHYAAFFANVRYYDRALFCLLEACALGSFETELAFLAKTNPLETMDLHPSSMSRMKDLARILWAMSEAGHHPEQTTLWETAAGYLRKRMRIHRIYLEPRHFIDCLHSLALVGIFPEDLLNLVPKLNFSKLQNSRTVLQQVNVLYQSLKIECSIENEGLRFIELAKLLVQRDRCQNMNLVHDLVKCCCGGDDGWCKRIFHLGHIPIEGLELLLDSNGKMCNIHNTNTTKNCVKIVLEVVESTKCMLNERQIPGLQAMKIRQLRKLGLRVIVIFPQDIQHLDGKSLQEKASWFEELLKTNI